MPNEQQVAFYIDLKVEGENGGVFVHSEQVPGLYLMGKCFLELKPKLETAIKRLFKDNHGKLVNVIWLSDAHNFPALSDVAERIAIYQVKEAA